MNIHTREAHLTWEEATEVKAALESVSYKGVKADRETLETHEGLVLLGYAHKKDNHYKVYVVNRHRPHKAIVKFDTGYIWVGDLTLPFYERGLKVIKPSDCIMGKEISKALEIV